MSDDFTRLSGSRLLQSSGEPDTIGPETALKVLPYMGQQSDDGPDILYLQSLPGTLLVGSDLDSARLRSVALSSQSHRESEKRRAYKAVADAESRYADAILRDALQAERPAGCWCLGYGGRNRRFLPMPTGQTITRHDGSDGIEIEEVEVLREHCGCPDGEARKLRDDDTKRRYWRQRDRQCIIRRFGEAKLPREYQRYRWRDHPDQAIVRRVEQWLGSPKDAEASHWLLLYGPGGRGKTTVLAGIAVEKIQQGHSVIFRTTLDLIDDIRATFGKPEEQAELIALLRRVEHLFLDDIGTEVPKDWVGEVFYGLLNHRHNEHLATYFSSNLYPRALGEHLGERIWGRVKRMIEPIEFMGDDLRDQIVAKKRATTRPVTAP